MAKFTVPRAGATTRVIIPDGREPSFERHVELLAHIRKAFENACPGIPVCEERLRDTFDAMQRQDSKVPDLKMIAELAFDLGLSFTIKFVPTTEKDLF